MPYFTTGSRQLFYTDTHGSSSGPAAHTILLVHGLGSTSSFFHPLRPFLSAFRLLSLDNAGTGRSPLGPTVSIASISADALALLDHLGISSATIVGYSMSGLVPLYIAATAPERITSAILLGPVNVDNKAGVDALLGRIDTVSTHGMESMADLIPETAPAKTANGVTRACIREMLLCQTVDGYVANIRAIGAATRPDYDHVRCPVLVVVGDEDKSCPVESCRRVFDGIQSEKKFEVVASCGHWYCLEKPEEVASLIRDWVG